MEKYNRCWKIIQPLQATGYFQQIKCLIFGLLFVTLLVGCSLVQQTEEGAEEIAEQQEAIEVADCTTKECFISSANDCNEISITLTEDAGVFTYSSSTECVFTKTLVSLDPSETQEMKSLLEGKSLTCEYEKGEFDQRWITSFIFGTEECEGELKDILVELIAFL